MILTHHIADGARRFSIRLAGRISCFVHAVQNTPMDGLEAVADVRQCTADNDGHRVIEIRPPHFVFDIDLIAFYE